MESERLWNNGNISLLIWLSIAVIFVLAWVIGCRHVFFLPRLQSESYTCMYRDITSTQSIEYNVRFLDR